MPLKGDFLTTSIETTPYRKVLVLVNPVGGKGKARSIVKEVVVPILEAAGCAVTVKGGHHDRQT